ncbi:dTDP-4-dehydrorhamnose 3,5-epimerase [Desulfovibrio sp. A2]|nr:dTDP-4-dehydrorhamnose 3,5-epimerase [Desulfovibrio sp. A2]
MQIIETGIPGLLRLEPRVFRDERGFFLETYRRELFERLGVDAGFVQDNHARSEQPGVLRGLHYQLPPAAQAKLVWATRGSVYDVAVDLRAGSPTYGQWYGCELSERNFVRLFVPRGFAHGYMTLEPGTEFQYKVDAYYAPEMEAGIAWDDPDLAIPWPGIAPILSEKDRCLPRLRDLASPFTFEPAPQARPA